MLGPLVIHALTFIVFNAYREVSHVQVGFVVYLMILLFATYGFRLVAKARMATLSIAQTFSILSYSQIYFIPFGALTRLDSSPLFRAALLLPPFVVQPFSAYRLSVLILPGDSELFYGMCHLAYGLAIVVLAIVKYP
jgi:hypothetical protein